MIRSIKVMRRNQEFKIRIDDLHPGFVPRIINPPKTVFSPQIPSSSPHKTYYNGGNLSQTGRDLCLYRPSKLNHE